MSVKESRHVHVIQHVTVALFAGLHKLQNVEDYLQIYVSKMKPLLVSGSVHEDTYTLKDCTSLWSYEMT